MFVQQNTQQSQYATTVTAPITKSIKTSTQKTGQKLVLSMKDGMQVVEITDGTVLGRFTDDAKGMVNLLPFGAIEAGVSRQHAYIFRNSLGELFVGDSGSRNGTVLNGQAVEQDRLYPLCDQDVLQLGTLIVHVLFIN